MKERSSSRWDQSRAAKQGNEWWVVPKFMVGRYRPKGFVTFITAIINADSDVVAQQ